MNYLLSKFGDELRMIIIELSENQNWKHVHVSHQA